ncbi:hypothetical protein OK349_17855 [Sphingomonas sp. BT-65]|uniref:hypothetical protein n=1 Tax=Sphingomonas sp. BT-65 TaxID=2989821 RepID=UPI002235F566|nr:hypothetical protein [Sphingomonas sp. BT-65]MCW4463576.1 hypothetical protein [Sphingomonas sp. BT-65]
MTIVAALPSIAIAQVAAAGRPSAAPTAPDGTPAFGIEPIFGIMGDHEHFDYEPGAARIPFVGRDLDGGLYRV